MPTIEELIAQLSFLIAPPAVFGVGLAAALIVMFRDWRLSVLALAGQAVLVGLLFTILLPPQIAGVKLLVGLFTALIYYVTGTQMAGALYTGVRPRGDGPWWRVWLPRPRFLFRMLAVAMVAVASWQAGQQIEVVFSVPSLIALGGALLVGLGLLNLGLSDSPFDAGLGLTTLLMGFELFYAAVEPALAVIAMLAAVDFAVALAVSYLSLVSVETPVDVMADAGEAPALAATDAVRATVAPAPEGVDETAEATPLEDGSA